MNIQPGLPEHLTLNPGSDEPRDLGTVYIKLHYFDSVLFFIPVVPDILGKIWYYNLAISF